MRNNKQKQRKYRKGLASQLVSLSNQIAKLSEKIDFIHEYAILSKQLLIADLSQAHAMTLEELKNEISNDPRLQPDSPR